MPKTFPIAPCAPIAALAFLVFTAVAPASAAPHSSHPQPGVAAAAPSTKAYEAAMMKMHEAMDVKYTGNADVDFVRGMIPHHQGAIDMAKVELEYGKDPANRKLAEEIIAAQEKEIASMQAWLKAHGG